MWTIRYRMYPDTDEMTLNPVTGWDRDNTYYDIRYVVERENHIWDFDETHRVVWSD